VGGAASRPEFCTGNRRSLPGPQKRGTGGTLRLVWKIHWDRRHPPIAAHGKPQSIRSDNGPELTSRHYLAWAIEWKIDLVHIQPGKPTQNGGMESFNGKLRDECLNTSWFWNLFDARNARKKISAWKTEYNSRRPHSSLAYRTPDEFMRQWQAASLSEAKSMAVDQPYQGDPDGLRFAPALTRLLHGQEIST